MSKSELNGAVSSGERPSVATEYGGVRGVRSGAITSFKGLPYAAAPTGELRWRSPRPPASWSGERDAAGFGPIAPQPGAEISGKQPSVTSEDCLSLNVFTPRLGAAGLPVMVWIHGGAYYLGSSADPLYDGAHLAETGNVVIVTLNYRIGALGFLDFTAFATPHERFESNLGLRDQLAALEWVQRNIDAFGGDPGNVTLFGESAGAGAVTTLMTAPRASGLFHAAIAESSPVGSVYTRERATGFAAEFLKILEVQPANIARLRTLSTAELTDACNRLVETNPLANPGTIPIAPVVDGDLVPEYPLTAFQNGTAMRIPLMIGTNHNEAQLFKLMRSPTLPTTVASVDAMVANLASPAARAIPKAYIGYPGAAAALHISTDAAFRMPTIWAATGHSVYAPTWVYEFDYVRPLMKLLRLGAMHAAELEYVWGNRPKTPLSHVPLGAAREAADVARRTQTRWLSFMHNRDPNPAQQHHAVEVEPVWPRYDAQTRATLMIDKRDRIVNDPVAGVRKTWGDAVISFR